jgi:hypothetical protein
MGVHLRIESQPTLREPVMIAAFRGWNDGAQGASLAASFLARSWDATRFADIDPEEFFDFQAVRPHVSLEDGLTRRIDWPENVFYTGAVPTVPPRAERDVILALGVEPAAIAARFDTVTLCLSKGLGCPLGALLAGSHELMARAWREKHLFGGAMRQAGVVAAGGVYALDHHVARLADDHARARRLAEALSDARVPVDLEQVETNFVQIDAARLGLDRAAALARLAAAGVGLSATIHPTVMRAVTHLDVTDDDIDRASELIPEALGLSQRSPAT